MAEIARGRPTRPGLHSSTICRFFSALLAAAAIIAAGAAAPAAAQPNPNAPWTGTGESTGTGTGFKFEGKLLLEFGIDDNGQAFGKMILADKKTRAESILSGTFPKPVIDRILGQSWDRPGKVTLKATFPIEQMMGDPSLAGRIPPEAAKVFVVLNGETEAERNPLHNQEIMNWKAAGSGTLDVVDVQCLMGTLLPEALGKALTFGQSSGGGGMIVCGRMKLPLAWEAKGPGSALTGLTAAETEKVNKQVEEDIETAAKIEQRKREREQREAEERARQAALERQKERERVEREAKLALGLSQDIAKTDKVKILVVNGEVEVIGPNGDLIPLAVGDITAAGNRIYTGLDSSVELELPDGHIMKIGEVSDVEVAWEENLRRSPVGTRLYWLHRGEMEIIGRSGLNSDWRIKTPTATCSIRGTKFLVLSIEKPRPMAIFRATEGAIAVTPDGAKLEPVLVKAGGQLRVTENKMIASGPIERLAAP